MGSRSALLRNGDGRRTGQGAGGGGTPGLRHLANGPIKEPLLLTIVSALMTILNLFFSSTIYRYTIDYQVAYSVS